MLYREFFPDGVIGIRVDGKTADTIAREIATSVGEIVRVGDERDSQTIMQCVAGPREMLLIFDNVENTDVSRLVPGGQCRVIITTRDRGIAVLIDVPINARIEVPPLATDLGLELLRNYVGAQIVDAEIAAAEKIVTIVGGLPLALHIVASLLAMVPWRRSLADVADELADERQRLSGLIIRDDPNYDVRVSFSASLKRLQKDEIDFFACLSVCHFRGFALATAAAAAGCTNSLSGSASPSPISDSSS